MDEIPFLGLPNERRSQKWSLFFDLPDGRIATIYKSILGDYTIGCVGIDYEYKRSVRGDLITVLAVAHHLIQTHTPTTNPKENTLDAQV